MEAKLCKNCKYFRRYYIRYSQRRYCPLEYGHCIEPRLKKRSVGDKGCAYWCASKKVLGIKGVREKPKSEEVFVWNL